MSKDLNKMYNHYLSNLDGKTAIITTPYTKLSCFYIKFDILQLPHLLGLHKIYRDSPKNICKRMCDSSISYEHLQRNGKFSEIKDRILLFDFILAIFLEEYNDSVIYVSDADRKGSSMRLDIAFSNPYKNKMLTMGLREISKDVYVPVTFYVKKKQPLNFPKSKRAKVLTLELIKNKSLPF